MPAPTQMPGDGELREQIAQLIKKSHHGISFSQFMEVALYDPRLGYYSRNPAIGRAGDFYTSVSVGACFGMLLGRQIRQIREQMGACKDFAILEQGAHDGQLAEDILGALADGEVGYGIAEPRPALREQQAKRLGNRVRQGETLRDLGGPGRAVYLCNELLDALPFERMRFEEGAWRQLRVTMDADGQLEERAFALEPEDGALLGLLPEEAAEGFTTEVCPRLEPQLREIHASFERGVAILIDYGMPSSEYFAPERAGGTMRTYRQHRATDAPFEALGQTDITAQVNFTHVWRFAETAGFEVLGYTDQNRFLTGIAESWLLEQEGQAPSPEQAALRRQFMTLTQPGNMGRLFKVLVLGKECGGLRLDGLKWTAPCQEREGSLDNG